MAEGRKRRRPPEPEKHLLSYERCAFTTMSQNDMLNHEEQHERDAFQALNNGNKRHFIFKQMITCFFLDSIESGGRE